MSPLFSYIYFIGVPTNAEHSAFMGTEINVELPCLVYDGDQLTDKEIALYTFVKSDSILGNSMFISGEHMLRYLRQEHPAEYPRKTFKAICDRIDLRGGVAFSTDFVDDGVGGKWPFEFRDPVELACTILGRVHIDDLTNVRWAFEETFNEHGDRTFPEMWNGTWWETAEKSISNSMSDSDNGDLSCQKILAIILYSDKSLVNNSGKVAMHPVYLTVGNLPVTIRNKTGYKDTVALFPVFPKNTAAQVKLNTLHACLTRIVEPLRKTLQGLVTQVTLPNMGLIRVRPLLAAYITDIQEMQLVCRVHSSWNCNRPCPTCMSEDLSEISEVSDWYISMLNNTWY